MRAGLRALAALWRDHLERRGRMRALDGIAEMNEHLLKDIGAPGWMISRAAARAETRPRTRFEMEV